MIRLLCFLALAFRGASLPARSPATEAHADNGVVFVNSVPVFSFKLSSNGEGPKKLADQAAEHLRTVDDDGPVVVRPASHGSEVLVGSVPVVLISPEEAVQHGKTPSALGEIWAANIRDALALPALKFSTDSLRLPVGSKKVVQLVGRLAYQAVINSSNEQVARVERDREGVHIVASAPGDVEVRATSGATVRTLYVYSRPVAAKFPQELSVPLTGDPAPASVVEGVLSGCIRSKLVRLPNSMISVDPVPVEPLAVGKDRTYEYHVRVRARDSFDGVGTVTVHLSNVQISRLDDTALWYSNSPESVTQVSSLFSAFLKHERPVRFLYHHINESTLPLLIRAEVINDTDEEARVLLVPGDSRPDKNPVRAGMTAAAQYLKEWSTHAGDIVELPAHSTFPISIRRLSPHETMSGLCTLRLLSGPPEVQVRADALPPFDLVGPWSDAALSSTPWREVGTHSINDYDRAPYEPSLHIYPSPNKVETMEYTVGDRFGTLLIGQKPIAGQDHTSNLDGNFGVVYQIRATLKNPQAVGADLVLGMEASAGYMGGVFLVDGKFVQTPLLSPKRVALLAGFHLAPGATRTVEIITLPVSGGSYPATLTIHPVEK